MWKIKEIKREARKLFKNNKWTLIVVSLFMTVIIGEYNFAQDSQINASILNEYYQDIKTRKS